MGSGCTAVYQIRLTTDLLRLATYCLLLTAYYLLLANTYHAGWKGVYQSTSRDSAGRPRWRAQATLDGRTTTLGSFHTEVEAALCYARHVQVSK